MKKVKRIEDLAIDLFNIYKNSKENQPFNVGIAYANHTEHLKNIINMKALSSAFKIESIYFDPKDMRDEFQIYWHQYKSHTIKNGKLEINLNNNYKRHFDLE